MLRHAIGFAVLSAMMILAGCSQNSWQATTYPAKGKLFVNGEPATNVVVSLLPKESAVDSRMSMPWGIVDESGVYVLTTYSTYDGAPPGEYLVTLRWPSTPSSADDRFNEAYFTPERSVATVVIEKSPNEIADINLNGIKVLPAK
jgi:hypothetical protein